MKPNKRMLFSCGPLSVNALNEAFTESVEITVHNLSFYGDAP
jgi:hypothetical protein